MANSIERFNKRYEQKIGNDSVYGNGTDGNFIVSNTSTPTVLTRDMYYDNLTVNANCVVITNGFRIFVKNQLINNGTIGATSGYTTAIADRTVAGQSSGTPLFSLSQSSSNPLPLTVLHDLEESINGYFVDSSATLRVLRGGDKGSDGSPGTGATSGGAGANGTAGTAGTGATAGVANPGGAGGHSGGLPATHVGGGAVNGSGGSGGHGHHQDTFDHHNHHHSGGHAGNPGTGNPGTNGAAGTAGAAGNPGNPGTNGAGGQGGVGGPVVLIAAKTISGSGSVVNVGQNGSSGNAGTAGSAGTGATSGNAGTAGAAGTGGNGNAGTAHGGVGHAYRHVGNWHNSGNVAPDWHFWGEFVHMRTFGGTPGRPANESNNAHFPHLSTRHSDHAFHWSGNPSTRTWPRGSVPANVNHFNTARGQKHFFHNASFGGAFGHHYTFAIGGGHGGAAGHGHGGSAGNPGNPGNPGNNGAAGLAGNPGNAGSTGREGAIIVVTDSWGLTQSLSNSTKIIINQ